MTTRRVRSDLYRAARLLGDAQAIRRGPKAMARREARKIAYRSLARLLRRAGL